MHALRLLLFVTSTSEEHGRAKVLPSWSSEPCRHAVHAALGCFPEGKIARSTMCSLLLAIYNREAMASRTSGIVSGHYPGPPARNVPVQRARWSRRRRFGSHRVCGVLDWSPAGANRRAYHLVMRQPALVLLV